MKSSTAANHFLTLAQAEGRKLAHMQAHQLVYVAHGVMLAHLDESLINEGVSAWRFGPVFPELYHELKQYGYGFIMKPISGVESIDIGDKKDCIEFVWAQLKNYTPRQLSAICTAPETPWHQVRVDKRYFIHIPDEVTKEYYKLRLNPLYQ